MLFVELALIRWAGENVIYLSYFSNFVLLGSFLGIGVGFLRARARTDLFPWSIVLLAFLIGFVLLFPVTINRSGNELIYFGTVPGGLPMWIMLPIIFLAVAIVMAAIAQGVARAFAAFEALKAYRLDILGSLAGIVAFSLLSFTGAPPVVWGTLVAIAFLVSYLPAIRLIQVVAALGLIVMFGPRVADAGIELVAVLQDLRRHQRARAHGPRREWRCHISGSSRWRGAGSSNRSTSCRTRASAEINYVTC